MKRQLSGKAKYAIKVGLAMAMVYGFAMTQGWMKPAWAGYAIAMAALPGQGQSLLKGLDRIGGTAFGCIVSLTVIGLFPQDRWYVLLTVAAYLAVVAYVQNGSRHAYFWTCAGFIVPLIMAQGLTSSEQAFETALFRTIETTMGVIVWTLVSVLIWPETKAGTLKSMQAKLIDAQRGMLAALGANGGTYADSRSDATAGIQQLATALREAGLESYKVQQLEPAWNRYLQLGRQYSGLLNRWVNSEPERGSVDVNRAYPGFAGFVAELDRRFAVMEQLQAGGETEPGPGEYALAHDNSYWEQASVADRAVLEVSLRLLQELDVCCSEMLKCVEVLSSEDGAAAAKLTHAAGAAVKPVLDPYRLRIAAMVPCAYTLGFLFWIYVPAANHMGLTYLSVIYALTVAGQPQWNISTLFKPLLTWFPLAMLCYVFIMPALSTYFQLSLLIFAFVFCVAYFAKGLGNLAGMLAFLNLMPIQNEQSYSFAAEANTFVFMFVAPMIAGVASLISRSLRPEQELLALLRGYFTSLAFVVRSAEQSPSNLTWWQEYRWRFHRQELAKIPQRIVGWTSAIDYGRLPDDSAANLHELCSSIENLSYRVDEFVTAWEQEQSHFLLSELREGLLDWTAGLEQAYSEFSHQETERTAESMRQVQQQRLDRLGVSLNSALSGATDEDSTAVQRANLYGLLGAFRGISEASLYNLAIANKIDWSAIREEKFSDI